MCNLKVGFRFVSSLMIVFASIFSVPEESAAQWGRPNWQGNRWQIGVMAQSTDTGVVLTNVVPNGPAASAGLVAGDRIIAIGGKQVGYVDGNLIDMGDEISQNVKSNGQVSVLVLAARGGLRNTILSFTPAENLIEGAAFFQGGDRLTTRAAMNVRLVDTTYNHWSGVEVYRWTVQPVSGSPLSFRLSYNQNLIQPSHTYALEAELVDGGSVLYRTSQPVQVTPGRGQTRVVLTPTTTSSRPVYYDQVNGWYQSYLGREPTSQEMYAWQNHMERGQPLSTIQSYLLGSSEYYNRYRDNTEQYLVGVYRSLYGTDPSAQQLNVMRQRYDQSNGIRSQFVQQMMALGASP